MRIQAPTGVSLKDRREITMTDFRGVDFSTSPLRVDTRRATDAKNFINEYGVNRKRHGWDQQFRILKDGIPQAINGVFAFDEGGTSVVIVHAGRRFYRAVLEGGRYSVTDVTDTGTFERARVDSARLTDTRSQAFLQKKRLYITGCGDFLVYGTWDEGATYELRRVVDNEDTYIPTTCIHMLSDFYAGEDMRAALDDVNLLSHYRINRARGAGGTYTVDAGAIDEGSDVRVHVKLIYDNGTDSARYEEYEGVTKDGGTEIMTESGGSLGSVDFVSGKIHLSFSANWRWSNDSDDNIVITYRHTEETYENMLSNCQFGTLFGIGGNSDRLFLAGNPDYPNVDFHSEPDDFTYFSDLATAAVGSDTAPIGGYARLSDSTLAIYKANAMQDAGIYYRTGRYDTYTDADGYLDELVAVFPATAGSVGESIVSRHASISFADDPLLVSENGVFGIALQKNVATSERYARERSRSINARLLAHKNLENAVATVFEGRYYLSVDGVCYVADSRYKYTREDDIDGSYNYEWWFLDNIPARVWLVMDGRLYFGTEDGRVCVFDDGYTDRTYHNSELGDISLNVATSQFTFREGLDAFFSKEDTVTVESGGLYSPYLLEASLKEGQIETTPGKIVSVYEGTEVFADNVGESGLSVGTRYTVGAVDRGLCRFSLFDEAGNAVSLSGGGFNLYRSFVGKELHFAEIGDTYFTLGEFADSEPLIFSGYDDAVPTGIVFRFAHRENVVAAWYTPVLDFGTNTYAKTLLGMTVSTEANINGKLSFGYETRTVSRLMQAHGLGLFSFDAFSFENFSFETAFASSYSKKVNVRNFNYVIFRFISDNDCDCAVNSFTVRYKINKENKGVR